MKYNFLTSKYYKKKSLEVHGLGNPLIREVFPPTINALVIDSPVFKVYIAYYGGN